MVSLLPYLFMKCNANFSAEYKDKFWWFGHMSRHEQAHRFDEAYLEKSMRANLQFAKVMLELSLSTDICTSSSAASLRTSLRVPVLCVPSFTALYCLSAVKYFFLTCTRLTL